MVLHAMQLKDFVLSIIWNKSICQIKCKFGFKGIYKIDLIDLFNHDQTNWMFIIQSIKEHERTKLGNGVIINLL